MSKIELFLIKDESDFNRAVEMVENNRPETDNEAVTYEVMLELIIAYDKEHHPLPSPGSRTHLKI